MFQETGGLSRIIWSVFSFGLAGPKSAACFGPRTKSARRFCPTHPVLVWPGLAVAVTGYPRVIRM